MSFPSKGIRHPSVLETDSDTFPVLLQLSRPLLDYRIVLAIIKGDVGAVNILKNALKLSNKLDLDHVLLALGPTTPLTLKPPQGSRILWATFTDGAILANIPRLTIVPPNQFTDLSLSFERLTKTRTGRIPLIVGDFLDNVLSVATDPAGLYAFLCKLFTRIRTNQQTAFFLATEDMHEQKKTAILKRFADVVIEYRAIYEDSTHIMEARILDHAENTDSVWNSNESPDYIGPTFLENRRSAVGRQSSLLVKQPIPIAK